jgi:3-dehydroquinate synthase
MYKQTETYTGDSVDYWIGKGALENGCAAIKKFPKVFVLVDENTEAHCLPVFLQQFQQEVQVISISSGEIHKNLNTLTDIWTKLTYFNADRDHLLINLGGGVITDMGGFAAAAYKRGMAFMQIPTTLLGQVDAAIGGKTGVDFNELKNHIGFFQNPNVVIIDPVFLDTLDERQWRSGFAEVMKYGFIMDSTMCDVMEGKTFKTLNASAWNQLIVRSVENKIKVVEEDGKELGLRKILNFGHTLGHAIETYFIKTGRPVTHGEAVAAGMICESWLSAGVSGLPQAELQKIVRMVDDNFPRLDFTPDEVSVLLSLTKQDKKVRNGSVKYSLLKNIGQSVFDVEVSDQQAQESLLYYINKR